MYRGLTQLNVTHTVVSNIILKRLNAYNDNQIYVMRQMMEKGYDYNRLIMLFIDFRLSFDKTGRNQLYVEYSEK